jgi:hypothetical protein
VIALICLFAAVILMRKSTFAPSTK